MATRDVLLSRNPATGLFDLQKDSTNNPKWDLSQTHAVLTQLAEYRGSDEQPAWLWDSTSGSGTPGTHGSLLYTIRQDTPEARSQFKAYALDALQPLVNQNRIANPTADVAASTLVRGRIDGVVSWTVPGDSQTYKTITPLSFPA